MPTEKKEFNNQILWNKIKLKRIGKNEPEESIKYVGINIDEDLTFKPHGHYVIKNLNKTHLSLVLIRTSYPSQLENFYIIQ